MTAGIYERLPFSSGLVTDYTQENGTLGITYGDMYAGRLPNYHRLDIGAKKKFSIGKRGLLEISLSITNTYNRKNIFYFDRISGDRVDQLPILVCLGANFSF